MPETELERAYLLTGSDRPKIETALARLRRHFEPEAVEVVAAPETGGAEAVALCNAGSLFGDARLVVVLEVDGRPNADGRLTGGWKAADQQAVADYLAAPAETTVLALVGHAMKKDSVLAKACAKAGTVLAYDAPKRDLSKWVAAQFKAAGVEADHQACAALVHLVGNDLRALAAEVGKIATWAAGEPIGEREVEQLVAASAETPSFALTDAWAMRDVPRTLELSEAIFEREGRPRRDVAPRLAAALSGHVGKLRQLKHLAAEGVRPRDAAGKLRMHPFYAEKLFGQAERFSVDELRDATDRLAALDLALKGAGRLPPDLELQRALVDLTRERGRRA
jgi:DNA polymerase III subunit delta